ncbi:MAG: hypothetical protein ACXWNC_07780 [Anaerolineales bacterium]
MTSILVIFLLTILRLGIPATILLLTGEAVRHHYERTRSETLR